MRTSTDVVALQERAGRRWHVRGVKLMIDGTVDNGTAWLFEPDARGESTESLWLDETEYRRAVAFFHDRGIPTTTHAIGDRGIAFVAEIARRTGAQRHAASHRAHRDAARRSARDDRVGRRGRQHAAHALHALHPRRSHRQLVDAARRRAGRPGVAHRRPAPAWSHRDVGLGLAHRALRPAGIVRLGDAPAPGRASRGRAGQTRARRSPPPPPSRATRASTGDPSARSAA